MLLIIIIIIIIIIISMCNQMVTSEIRNFTRVLSKFY